MTDQNKTTEPKFRVVKFSARERMCFQAGRDARIAGKPESDNPEPRCTIWRDAWWDGWNCEDAPNVAF